MTRYRVNIAVLSAAIVLLSLSLFLSYFLSPEGTEKRNAVFSLVSSEEIAAVVRIDIELAAGVERFSLEKKDSVWRVIRNGKAYPAKQERAAALLKLFSEKAEYALAAATEKAYSTFGLSETLGSVLSLRAASGALVARLIVGDLSPDGRKTYIRRAAEQAAYLADLGFYEASSGAVSWFDLALFPERVSAESVQRVRVASDDFSYTLARGKSPDWYCEERPSAELDPVKVNSWISTLLSIEASTFADADKAARYETSAELAMELGDGSVRRIAIARNRSGLAPAAVRVFLGEYVYSFEPSQTRLLYGPLDALLKKKLRS